MADNNLALVLNVISYSHAYSLYPRATFHNRVSLELIPNATFDESVRTKYSARGWRFIQQLPRTSIELLNSITGQLIRYPTNDGCSECAHCRRKREEEESIIRAFPTGPRWIGDKHSWVLPLNLEGVQLPTRLGDSSTSTPMSRDPSFITTWRMVDRRPEGGLVGKKIEAKLLAGNGFWYTYVITDERLKKAMAMIQELYVHIPTGSSLPSQGEEK